ncbi:deleted in lung and esophageal cancer protein 1 isoform X1 [Pangasianodon hypophthalmus]|uniref:deleted in lung and esophageal cancer protein 1 isoform X1 n=1 Tax=Pangasianodon hypophthalmus TaxID=310915 RepID=UPI002307AC16|nr:deleted in lung and esophageal cancer protein 1 isoform X1 [Pangasianodon hypophthalmus]
MSEESDQKCEDGIEPSMNRHKPASEKTQDISHLLASIFKDLYTTEVIGKDTVANLSKSYRRGNDHHAKYVEALQQVHLEYNRRIQDADMLEKHIIQARLKARDTEEHVQSQLMEEVGESYHQLGLPPVRSTFMWCVDNRLLKSHNLICPQDYIIEQVPFVKAPQGKSVLGFAQPTVSFNMHASTQPRDDGYTLIPEPVTAQSLLEESEGTLTLSSSQDTFSIRSDSSQKVRQAPKPLCKEKPSPDDSAALQKFKKCQNFLRNPHFQPLSHQRGGKSLIMREKRVEKGEKGKNESPEDPMPIFIANPPVVLFTDYQIGDVYETTVELKNTTAASRHVRVIPPTTPHFSTGLGRFPGDGGIIAPGMSCQYTVRFAPDSLADYEDFLVVETQSPYPLIIPVEAHRPPPVLTLPAVLDLGYCLVGGVKPMEVVCRNDGYSAGTFCIMPKRQWPASSLRSAVKACFAEEPPFAISPSLFYLLPGQVEVMQVVFFPTTAESFAQSFTIVCDNCHVKDFSIQGTGQLVMLELVALEGGEDLPALGELRDLTADHFIRFEPTNVHSVLQKKVIIKNNTHLELPFHWRIMKPNLQCLLPGETPDPSCIQHHAATDNAFSISPATGLLDPAQECVFLLTYCPEELKDYHSVCHLVIMNVPNLQNIHDNSHASQQSDPVGDVIAMELEVKGSTEPYRILLEPYALFIPGESYIHTTIRKGFKMWNHSKSAICFQWECISDRHSIEVEPSFGEIETNACFDMDLILTGGRPGCLTTTLQCHVQHHSNPVVLPIEVTFKGPDLSVNVPGVDLGLLQLGQEVCATLQISNSSPLEAQWSLEELPSDPALNQGQVSIEPSQGVLPPSSSCSVNVLFRAVCCQSFESVLQLAVLNGTGCYLPVRAEVQRPQVCLLSSQMALPDLYVGVAQSRKAALFNQTLLQAHFMWSKLQGPQAHLCSASFTPSSGTLGPNAHMEISVSFTAHTDEELTEVAAVCEVEGMEKPLVLNFCSKAKGVSVSYSLPHTDRAASDVTDEQPVVLDFTEDEPVFIGKSANRQLLITNHTAISASFIIEAEVFSGHRSTESVKNSKQGGHSVKTPFRVMQSKKIEEKEYEEFVRGLLAHGKGVAFLVEPEKGMLGPFETVTINVTAHSNMWGDYEDHLICKVGYLEPTLIPMRISVKGCPIYFQMIGPQPENQNQGPVIRFGTHISGGDTVSRSLRLNNTSAYDIRLDWVTYNKETEDRKLIDLLVAYGEPFPLKDVDGNEVVGGPNSHVAFLPRLDQSQTPSTEGSSPSLRTKSETSDFDEEQFEEEERGARVSLASVRKLFSVFIQPHEGYASDYPYCITPQQIVVPAGGSSTIHVSFTPLTLSDPAGSHTCVGYALGFMSLHSKVPPSIVGKVARAQGYELEPLRLDMLACVKPAILTVQMEEDEDTLEFSAAASDLLDGHTLRQECVTVRTLQLINSTDVLLSFTLNTQWPFSVLQHTHRASSNSPSHTHSLVGHTERQHTLLLPPKHNMQVKVAFHLSASLLSYQSQPCTEAPPTVTLLCGERGERRLRFQHSLTIQYSNNSVQSVGLCAHLALPTLHLSSDSVDFGTCYVGQTRVKEVYLSNRGGSSSFWTAMLGTNITPGVDAEEESKVFRVSPEHGLLKPVEHPISSSRQALEISFTPSDQESFQTTITVQGILGEPCLTLHIQGRGSLDERYVSQTPDT